MKKLLSLLIVLATLASCSSGSDDGTRLGNALVAAWNDNTALDSVLNAITTTRDDLTFTGSFDEALIEAATKSDNVTIEMAAHLLTESDENFAERQAHHIVEALLNGKCDRQTATARLNAGHEAAERLGRAKAGATLDAAIDEQAASLPINDQMKVYSAATTPANLGAALARETDADKEDIEKRIEALRAIYSTEDFNTFITSYNDNL